MFILSIAILSSSSVIVAVINIIISFTIVIIQDAEILLKNRHIERYLRYRFLSFTWGRFSDYIAVVPFVWSRCVVLESVLNSRIVCVHCTVIDPIVDSNCTPEASTDERTSWACFGTQVYQP